MGRTEKGPLGTTVGTIGPLVYYKWKGMNCVRTKPKVNKQRKLSAAESNNREKFAYLQAFLSRITPFVRQGFHNYAENKTAFSSAMSYNLKHAMLQTAEGKWSIHHPTLKICKGTISPLTNIKLNYTDQMISCTWEYDKVVIDQLEAADFRTIVLVVADDPADYVNGIVLGSYLHDNKEEIALPYIEKNKTYHVHLAFVCVEHTDRKFDSTYLGTFNT